ncbi:hypothetical protein TNCV_4461651 [Trichonephila clavipes]|nr:hypothetical protein TNCV_4461651 [Trichonephila clavipes]
MGINCPQFSDGRTYVNGEARSERTSVDRRQIYPFSCIIQITVGRLVVRTSDYRPEGLGLMPRVHTEYVLVKSVVPKILWAESRVQRTGECFPPLQFHAYIVEVEIGGVAIYRPFGNLSELNHTVTCMVLKSKANDRRTSSPLPRRISI